MKDYDAVIKEGKEATSYDMAPSGTHARDLVRKLTSALESAVAERDHARGEFCQLRDETDYSKVTRVTMVPGWTKSNPQYQQTQWADSWKPLLQDDGRTLKLIGEGNGHEAMRIADEEWQKSMNRVSKLDKDL